RWRPELSDLHDARRVCESVVYPGRPGLPKVGPEQVVAHNDVAHAIPAEQLSESGGTRSGGHALVDGLQQPGVPDRADHAQLTAGPVSDEHRLQDVVERASPGVLTEPGAWFLEDGRVAGVLIQPSGRAGPVLRDARKRALYRQPSDVDRQHQQADCARG